MEIVLQWLDELDDLVFTFAMFWRSFCRFGLALGLLAAIVLTPVYEADLRLPAVIGLTAVAGGSVLAWSTAALISIRGTTNESISTA